MSLSPRRLLSKEREANFDANPIRTIICNLLVQTVEDVESPELEIKGWCKDDRELAEKVAEACACIANTLGGLVLVGIADSVNSPRKFSRCPHSSVNTSWLESKVHELTKPPVECHPYDATHILTEVVGQPAGNLYALRVPRTRHISGHVTHKGISKIRKGKQCVPQYLAEDDRTTVIISQASVDDLSPASIDWAIAEHQKQFHTVVEYADPTEFLSQSRLVEPYLPDEDYRPTFQPTLAAILLFGKVSAVERYIPAFETIVIIGRERKSVRKNIIESVRELCLGESSFLKSRLPLIPVAVLKELVVNAYIHRCYRTPSPVEITISDMGLEIKSPGELLGGLTANNLIYGVPVYRNLLLADGARFAGLCDKVGQGIDLIYKSAISEGLGFPEFESGNSLFTASIPIADSAEFKEYIRHRSEVVSKLDEVIALRTLWGKDVASVEELAFRMQRRPEKAEGLLQEMSQRLIIERFDDGYRLSPAVRQDIQTIFRSLPLPFDETSV